MEYDDFKLRVLFALGGIKGRELGAIALGEGIYKDDATAALRGKAAHDKGQFQSAQFINFMERLEREGIVRRSNNPEGGFRYALSKSVAVTERPEFQLRLG